MKWAIAILLPIVLATTQAQAQDWETVVNERFGYSLDMPVDYTGGQWFDDNAGEQRFFNGVEVMLDVAYYGSDNADSDLESSVTAALNSLTAKGYSIIASNAGPTEASYVVWQDDRRLDVRIIKLCASENDLATVRVARRSDEIAVTELNDEMSDRILASLKIARPSTTCPGG